MVKVTVINCYQLKNGPIWADFIDPTDGRVVTTVKYPDPVTANAIASRLALSGQWKVAWSLSGGFWRATRLSLLDRNCPGWREAAEENALANRR